MYSQNWLILFLVVVICFVNCNSQTRRNVSSNQSNYIIQINLNLLIKNLKLNSIFFQVNQAQQSLAERVSELNRLSLKKSVIRLNTEKFRLFVGSKSIPRNYSVIVMMTALSPHRQCQVCRSAYDEFLIVANSFIYSPSFQSQLYFAMVDFDEGSEIFQQLSLNSAPIFLHFSPKGM